MNHLLVDPRISHRLGALFYALVFSCLSCSSSKTETAVEPDGGANRIDAAFEASQPALADDAASSADVAAPSDGRTPTETADGRPDVIFDDAIVTDDGPLRCQGMTLSEGAVCPTKTLGSIGIVGPEYEVHSSSIVFGEAPDLWDFYAFAPPGQSRPEIVASASSVAISAEVKKPDAATGWVAVGASISGPFCVEESNFATGLVFTLSGDLGGCLLYLDALDAADQSAASDPCRGACRAASCVPPSIQVTQTGTQTVPNMSFAAGGSEYGPNSSKLIGYRWRLVAPESSTGCSARFTLGDVRILGI